MSLETVPGGRRLRYSGADEPEASLEQALTAFRERMWASRYPAPIAPKARDKR